MLTRLQIDGFKNLRGVDLRFGPLICIAGSNGVGQSKRFDAIALLSDLASMPLVKAATRVRGTSGRLGGIAQLFGRYGDASPVSRLTVAMIVPRRVSDDFDRPADATASCLRATLEWALKTEEAAQQGSALQLQHEELVALSLEATTRELKFQPDRDWKKRYLKGPGSRTAPSVETLPDGVVKLWGDTGGRGRRFSVPAAKSPQTLMAGVSASTHPTALAARREMHSWRQLQLAATARRAPDEFGDDNLVSATGGHLPNALRQVRVLAEDLPRDGLDDQVAAGAAPRQGVISPQSPLVVKNLADDTLLMADTVRQQGRDRLSVKALPGAWRAAGLQAAQVVSKGALATCCSLCTVTPRAPGQRVANAKLMKRGRPTWEAGSGWPASECA